MDFALKTKRQKNSLLLIQTVNYGRFVFQKQLFWQYFNVCIMYFSKNTVVLQSAFFSLLVLLCNCIFFQIRWKILGCLCCWRKGLSTVLCLICYKSMVSKPSYNLKYQMRTQSEYIPTILQNILFVTGQSYSPILESKD